jgi:lambda repressor-like predicted transcriptional regulator
MARQNIEWGDELLVWLGRTARQLRQGAKPRPKMTELAARAGVDNSTLRRFELGRGWPRNPGRIVATYAEALDMSPIEFWEEAVGRWRSSLDGDQPPRQGVTS